MESCSVTSFPFRVDLSGLGRPGAFLAALKQHTAREINHPLENLRLRAHWIDDRKTEQWKVSVIIEGLLISGISKKKKMRIMNHTLFSNFRYISFFFFETL